MKIGKIYNQLLTEVFQTIKPLPIVYHTSNPIFRETIDKEGLIPKQESWGKAIGSDMNAELGDRLAIFVSNDGEHYDSTYDDDVWAIDTSKINNIWYKDKHYTGGAYTFEPINRNVLKLIYRGTGNSTL
jgi:hypothetical protein